MIRCLLTIALLLTCIGSVFAGRYYSSENGRFISRDSLGYVDDMSLYNAYFIPNAMDPTGNRTLDFGCGSITINMEKNSLGSLSRTVTISATNNGKCCECDKIIGAQWVTTNGKPWTPDNPHNPHGSWYNYNPNTDSFTGNDDGKTLGGDGVIIDAPQPTKFIQYSVWQSCFYCKKKGGGLSLLGCVSWYMIQKIDGRYRVGEYGHGHPPGKPMPSGAPPAHNPNLR